MDISTGFMLKSEVFLLTVSLKPFPSKVRMLFTHLWFHHPCINNSCTCAYQVYMWHQSGACPTVLVRECIYPHMLCSYAYATLSVRSYLHFFNLIGSSYLTGVLLTLSPSRDFLLYSCLVLYSCCVKWDVHFRVQNGYKVLPSSHDP